MTVLRFQGPWVLCMGFIFYLSSRTGSDTPSFAPDYVLHGIAYCVLGVLTVRAFAHGLGEPRGLWLLAAALGFTVLYGASDEWHQSFVPGRDPSLRDVLWDAVGALVAVSSIALFWRWKQRRGARY